MASHCIAFYDKSRTPKGTRSTLRCQHDRWPNLAAAGELEFATDADGVISDDVQDECAMSKAEAPSVIAACCRVEAGEAVVFPRYVARMERGAATGHAVERPAGDRVSDVNGLSLLDQRPTAFNAAGLPSNLDDAYEMRPLMHCLQPMVHCT